MDPCKLELPGLHMFGTVACVRNGSHFHKDESSMSRRDQEPLFRVPGSKDMTWLCLPLTSGGRRTRPCENETLVFAKDDFLCER